MRRFVIAGAAMLALAGAAQAAPRPGDAPAQAGEASKEYAELKAEYDKAMQAYSKAYREAKTPEAKQEANALRPDTAKFAERFSALAAKDPKSAVALDCMLWVLQNHRAPAAQDAALALLLEHHTANPAMARVSPALEYSQSPKAEALLRAVRERCDDREAKGRASFALARMLSSLAELSLRAKTDPEIAGNLESWYGADAAKRITSADEKRASAEAEGLYDEVASKYADLKHGRGTLGDTANGNLFELRNLAIGKSAPEIVGADENGKSMKLSDFRGKVVMLDFWGFW